MMPSALAPYGTASDDSVRLADQALAALQWSMLGRLAQVGAQIAIGIILARLLGPEPFGVVAAAWLVIGVGNQLADFGLASALVQRRVVSAEEVQGAFTLQLLVGCGLTLFAAACAPLIAACFRRPDIGLVICVLSLIFTFQAFGQTPLALLRRRLDLKSIQSAQLFSYLVAYLALGIPLALSGLGVWALVFAQLLQSACNGVLLWRSAPHPLALRLSGGTRALMGFGGAVVATNLANTCISSLDTAVLGRAFGMSALGLYNRASALVLSPTSSILSAFQAVVLPAYSKVQDDNVRIGRAYCASLSAVGIVWVPALLVAAACSDGVIAVVFGKRWIDAGPLLLPLGFATAFHSLMGLAGAAVWAKGRVALEAAAQFTTAGILLASLLVSSRFSLLVVAWTVAGVYFVRLVLMSALVVRLVQVPASSFVAALRGPLLVSGCLFAAARLHYRLLNGVPDIARLGQVAVLATGLWLALIVIFRRLIFTVEFSHWASALAGRLPTALRTRIPPLWAEP